MAAVLLALTSAALFGAMTVLLRLGLARAPTPYLGAFVTAFVAFIVCSTAAAVSVMRDGELALGSAWEFALAGLLAPGAAQILFLLAVRDAGPSRTSVVLGTAPLPSVAIALVVLGEPFRLPLAVGALLIVAGAMALAGESLRPESFKALGLAFAAGTVVLFATRDNLLRWFAGDTETPPLVAAAAAVLSGSVLIALFIAFTRPAEGRHIGAAARAFLPAGVLFGLSYVSMFEAYYRGRVTVVSPLIATEALFGVAFAALLMRGADLVGRRLLAGAGLVVAGGALIGAFR